MPRKSSHPPPPREVSELADRLHGAVLHLLRRLRRFDDASGLTAPKLSALSVLVFGGPRSVGELAAVEQVRPPTVTRMVKELEADGLVRREPVGDDRRVVRVRATPKARRILRSGRARRITALATWLQSRKKADLTTLEKAAAIIDDLLPH